MSNSKRKRQQEDYYQQLKTHVGPKEIAYNFPVHMNAVYGTYNRPGVKCGPADRQAFLPMGMADNIGA